MKKTSEDLLCLPDFHEWFADIAVEIETVQELLAERLSDSAAVLTEQLSKIEAWQSRVTKLLADANAHLDRSEYQALMAINRELTVLERETEMKFKVLTERRIRDIILGLCESIKGKLILGMSTRKQSAGERSDFTA